jgi:type I restriction enzyme S subunit
LSCANVSRDEIGEKFLAKPGNILIAMTGATVGKFGIVPKTEEPLYVNQRVGFFNLGKDPTIKLPFLINSLNQSYFREAIFTLASGAAQPNISNEQINNIQLIFPEKTLIEEFNYKFNAVYNKLLSNRYQNQKLTELRDWLLPMLMNGQVKVN